jgi:hypothetical protein
LIGAVQEEKQRTAGYKEMLEMGRWLVQMDRCLRVWVRKYKKFQREWKDSGGRLRIEVKG